MAIKTLKQSDYQIYTADNKRRCRNVVHGAAQPVAVEGMLLCRHCLTNLDWQRYFTNSNPTQHLLVTLYGTPRTGKTYYIDIPELERTLLHGSWAPDWGREVYDDAQVIDKWPEDEDYEGTSLRDYDGS